MAAFGAWATSLTGNGRTLVFVGFNAKFDWSFVNYYFHQFTGGNPFGFAALDIKALCMGVTGCSWADTRSSQIAKHLAPQRRGAHDALHDAKYQAELFRLVVRSAARALARGKAAPTSAAIQTREKLHQVALDLIRSVFPPPKGVQLVGVSLSNFRSQIASEVAELPFREM